MKKRNNIIPRVVKIFLFSRNLIALMVLIVLLSSCNEETLPKPKGFLRLSYKTIPFEKIQTNCPYTFEVSNNAILTFNKKCWVNITYPKLKASLNITYRPVENNLKELLRESEKLTYNHTIKADNIITLPFENSKHKKYGALAEVIGNAASPIQFHLTDSTKHFITGALYFKVQPNYDSILPAIKFVEKDIKHLMETLEWKE